MKLFTTRSGDYLVTRSQILERDIAVKSLNIYFGCAIILLAYMGDGADLSTAHISKPLKHTARQSRLIKEFQARGRMSF